MGLLQSLIHGASDAVFVADVETGEIVFVNDAACRLMEAAREDILGVHQTELHPKEDLDDVAQKFRTFISSDGYKETQARVCTREGNIKPVLITSAERFEDNGRMYISAFFKDITPEEKLKEVTVLQSHMVRKHLANILGITNILNDPATSVLVNKDELIQTLGLTARELDAALRNVVRVAGF